MSIAKADLKRFMKIEILLGNPRRDCYY